MEIVVIYRRKTETPHLTMTFNEIEKNGGRTWKKSSGAIFHEPASQGKPAG